MTEVAAPLFETTRSRALHRPVPERLARDSKGLQANLRDRSSPARVALQGIAFESAERNRGVTEPVHLWAESRARAGTVFQPRKDQFFATVRCRVRAGRRDRSAAARRLVAVP